MTFGTDLDTSSLLSTLILVLEERMDGPIQTAKFIEHILFSEE